MQQSNKPPLISDAVKRYTLGVLVVVYTFNFIDRQILSILIEPIKNDLDVTDFGMGLLSGTAFAIFYATLGMPLALIADRWNRRNLIGISLAVWSGMTALSGLAMNFWHLAAARIGVGIGEAGCSPAAHSMLADLYPAKERATALGIYSLGIPFGVMFGLFAGGAIADLFGWRWAFFIVGIPGLVLAAIVFMTVKEPPRGLADGLAAGTQSEGHPSIMEVFRFLMQRRSFRHMVIGGGLTAFVGYGLITWVPTFFLRSHGMTLTEAGFWLGLVLGIPGGVGIVLGGWLSDQLGARDARWYLWMVAVALAVGVPVGAAAFLVESWWVSLLLLCLPVMLGNFYQGTTFAQTQGLAPVRMRAVAAAILLFILNFIGFVFGPPAVGVLSDLLASSFGSHALRYSLLCWGLVNLWAAFHYWRAGRWLPGDLESR
ncbi:MAG: MFS transporter [Gammaproteobacteria bacterium]|nr:MFS transporter [Gammaproteobacteria bacterium]